MKIEVVNATIKITEERLMMRALFPYLSTANPKNGLIPAEMKYGIPKSWPALFSSKPYFYSKM